MKKSYYVFFNNWACVEGEAPVIWDDRVDMTCLSDVCDHVIGYNNIADDIAPKTWPLSALVTSDCIDDYLHDKLGFYTARYFLNNIGISYGKFFDTWCCLVPKKIVKNVEDFFELTSEAEKIIKNLCEKYFDIPWEDDCKLYEIAKNVYNTYNPNDDIFNLILQGYAESAAEQYTAMWKEIKEKIDALDL